MSPGDGAEILALDFLDEWSERWFEAWNGQDAEALAEMCSEDLVLDDPALPEALHGRAGVRSFAADTFRAFPDVRLQPLESPCSSRRGGGAWLPYRMSGTMDGFWRPLDIAPTGAAIAIRGVTEWGFRDGLLIVWDTIYDNLDLARQMGIVPPQGSRGDRLFSRLQHVQARGRRRANRNRR